MTKRKIRDKRPGDSIKEKTPDSSSFPDTALDKTPNNDKRFVLPPKRQPQKKQIPKSEVKIPSNYGALKKENKALNTTNRKPPAKERTSKSNQHKNLPTSGAGPKKMKIIGTKPPKSVIQHRTKTPSRKGVVDTKKPTRMINKKPPKSIVTKTPGQTKKRFFPSNIGITDKKSSKKTVNTPPPNISKKTPKIDKEPPVTTQLVIKDKIPKTKIHHKKPR